MSKGMAGSPGIKQIQSDMSLLLMASTDSELGTSTSSGYISDILADSLRSTNARSAPP